MTLDLLPTMGGFFHLDALENDCFNSRGFYSDECAANRLNLTQTCRWYWCQSENGCIRVNPGQSCNPHEAFLFLSLGNVCMCLAFFSCLAIFYALVVSSNETGKAFGIGIYFLLPSIPSGILAYIAFNECSFQCEVPVLIDAIPPIITDGPSSLPTTEPTSTPSMQPVFLPTSKPSPVPTSFPTNTYSPTAAATIVSAALNRGIAFDDDYMETTGLILLSIYWLTVPFSIYFICKAGEDCKSTMIIIYTVFLSQLDICMDITYIFYATWTSSFLRVLSIVVMFLPCTFMMIIWRALISDYYCRLMWPISQQFGQLCGEVYSGYKSCFAHNDDRSCPFREFHEFISWIILTTLFMAFCTLAPVMFVATVVVASAMFIITLFIAFGSKGFSVVIVSAFKLDRKDAAMLFYGSVLAE